MFAEIFRLKRQLLYRIGASLVIVTYTSFLAWHLTRQAVGDPIPGATAYFFTWDMFPYYYSWSSRRTAVGKTRDGRYVELVPAAHQRFRSGAEGTMTRADLERTGKVLRLLADDAVQHTAEAERSAPVQHVWLLEEYWPEKFNLRPELYQRFWGSRRPDRTYWRTLSEYDVADTLKPTTAQPLAGGTP